MPTPATTMLRWALATRPMACPHDIITTASPPPTGRRTRMQTLASSSARCLAISFARCSNSSASCTPAAGSPHEAAGADAWSRGDAGTVNGSAAAAAMLLAAAPLSSAMISSARCFHKRAMLSAVRMASSIASASPRGVNEISGDRCIPSCPPGGCTGAAGAVLASTTTAFAAAAGCVAGAACGAPDIGRVGHDGTGGGG